MKLLVAGSGRVATALGGSLVAAGASVERWSRAHGLEVDSAVVGAPEIAIIAVSDSAISEVAERLLSDGIVSHATILLHTAGSITPGGAFAGVRGLVGGAGLMHPLRAIAGGESDRSFAGVIFGIAGDAAGRLAATRVVAALGGTALMLEDAALPRYHAAAVLASNHTLALLDASVGLLVHEGLDRREAEIAAAGLMASAARNVAGMGLPLALTGPIARGDEVTVANHLAVLTEPVLSLYRETGIATIALARRRSDAPVAALDRIASMLLTKL